MNCLKNALLTLTLFIASYAIGQDGQSAYYKKAAKIYRDAAAKTKCPSTRGNVLIEYAKWNERMVEVLAGTLSSAGTQPTTPIPECEGDMIDGGSTHQNSKYPGDGRTSIDNPNQQQAQQDLTNAQNATINTFENAINTGRKTSAALIDATLEGAQYISDPKTSLAYTGIGLGASLVSWISERKEEERSAMLRREQTERLLEDQELRAFKESFQTSSDAFNFVSGSTDYHFTKLKIEIKRGMVKSITRNDLYDINVEIHKIVNTTEAIFIYESVKFTNIKTSADSCVVNKISIPIHHIADVQLYSGDYTNAYDPKSSSNQIFRHKNLTNAEIKEAFTITPMYNEGNQIGSIQSKLMDLSITTLGDSIMIQKKYVSSKPFNLSDSDFNGIGSFSANNYMLVFDSSDRNTKLLPKFVSYLNYIRK